jgi:hypothetical protein
LPFFLFFHELKVAVARVKKIVNPEKVKQSDRKLFLSIGPRKISGRIEAKRKFLLRVQVYFLIPEIEK